MGVRHVDKAPTDERTEELRAEVGRAIQAFVEYQQGLYERPGFYVDSWAVSFNGATPQLEQNEQALQGVIVADGQAIPMSVGLFEIAKRHWM